VCAKQSTKGFDLRTINIDEQMKVYPGGGCNSIVFRSNDGRKAIIVDTKYFSGAKKLRSQIAAPDITIINTHFHLDHARGNRLYPEAFVISGNTNWKQWNFDTAHSKHPHKILNPGDEFIINIDDEIIHVIDMGKAHSPNDLIAYFEKRKVLAAGDLIWKNMHPVLLDKNTNVKLWISYLDKIAKLYDIQIVVPGHGEISDKNSIIDMREYFISISNAIYSHDKLKEVKRKYSFYSTFPFFGRFHRTVKILKREMRNQSDLIK
jgi:cyclase